jgi:hypothetical protein
MSPVIFCEKEGMADAQSNTAKTTKQIPRRMDRPLLRREWGKLIRARFVAISVLRFSALSIQGVQKK